MKCDNRNITKLSSTFDSKFVISPMSSITDDIPSIPTISSAINTIADTPQTLVNEVAVKPGEAMGTKRKKGKTKTKRIKKKKLLLMRI